MHRRKGEEGGGRREQRLHSRQQGITTEPNIKSCTLLFYKSLSQAAKTKALKKMRKSRAARKEEQRFLGVCDHWAIKVGVYE